MTRLRWNSVKTFFIITCGHSKNFNVHSFTSISLSFEWRWTTLATQWERRRRSSFYNLVLECFPTIAFQTFPSQAAGVYAARLQQSTSPTVGKILLPELAPFPGELILLSPPSRNFRDFWKLTIFTSVRRGQNHSFLFSFWPAPPSFI